MTKPEARSGGKCAGFSRRRRERCGSQNGIPERGIDAGRCRKAVVGREVVDPETLQLSEDGEYFEIIKRI